MIFNDFDQNIIENAIQAKILLHESDRCFVQSDFLQKNQISRAIDLGAMKSANLLMENILK